MFIDADGDGYDGGQSTVCYGATVPAGYMLTSSGTDCNDTDATKNATFMFYADTDADGFGAGSLVAVCAVNATTPPAGYALNNTDCAPENPALNATYSFYEDEDGDGVGASGRVVSVCAVDANTPPAGYSLSFTDCNDSNALIYQSASLFIDADGDGYDGGQSTVCYGATVPAGYMLTSSGTDCNDAVYSLTNTCSSIVNLKLNIQGYYDTASHAMRPVMANQGVGTSATDVDDVTVELRDSSTNALVASATARLHTDGTATATFVTAPSGSFYIAVKHRNAIETWSATAQTVGATPLTYDFSAAANNAYGNNMILLETGVYGFYSGDLNQDGFIEGLDYPQLFNDSNNLFEGYYATDLNGDGFVEGLDYPILFNNSNNLIETVHP